MDTPPPLSGPIPHRVRMSGHGVALLDYLVATFASTSAEALQEAVAEGRFRLAEGEVLGADTPLRFGQTLLASIPHQRRDDPFLPTPTSAPRVLFADTALLVVDKPAGLLSYPLGPRRLSALTLAGEALAQAGEAAELRPLHRIDVETSGVLMMARTLQADRTIKEAFRRRQISKTYLALVRGALRGDPRIVRAPIGPDEGGPIRIKMAVHANGSPAETHIEPLDTFSGPGPDGEERSYSWVRARPITGRTHQIRVHLAYLGHPIVGDKMYCDGGIAFLRRWEGKLDRSDLERLELPRHALHAEQTELAHPSDGRPLRLVADLSEDLCAFARQRGGRAPTKR